MSYYNVVEVESAIANLAGNYPTLCTLIELPHKTAEKRCSHALKISAGGAGSRPVVMLTAGVHGREWGSCEIVIAFAADLLLAYSTPAGVKYGNKLFPASDILAILGALDVVIFPLVNPDGRFYSQQNDGAATVGWRKNRNNPDAHPSDSPAIGVDINRNFDFLWDFPEKFIDDMADASKAPADEKFHGISPFSEFETLNVKSLLDAMPATRWFIDIHCIGKTILRSWGSDENQSSHEKKNFRNPLWDHRRGAMSDNYGEFIPREDDALSLSLAVRMKAAIFDVNQQTYRVTTPFGYNGGVSGAGDDYVYSRQWLTPRQPKIQAFVIEFGLEFHPPWERMEPHIDDISAALFQFCVSVTP